MTDLQFEVVIVGAGPTGLAAACAAAESGRRVGLLDETPWLGGQIWRGHQPDRAARDWFGRLRRSGAVIIDRTSVFACPEPGLLLAERAGLPCRIRWKRLVVATGGRELFLPFPGWTLPCVIGPGGLLGLVKSGWPIAGQRVVVAGTGPLLLAAAVGLAKHGAKILAVVEQAPWRQVARFGLALCRHPAKLWQGAGLGLGLRGVSYRFGSWPVAVEGNEQVQNASFTNGHRSWTTACDVLACGFGLVPNVELALALGCELSQDFVRVDERQATTVPDVYCAGEPTGIGGADCGLVEGQIAGYAAAGRNGEAQALFETRATWHRFRHSLARAFALRPELKVLARNDTVVCRCEDVPLHRLREFDTWREAKLHARCGMGPCQGRVCGPATKHLFGWGMESVRPPVCPAPVGSLIVDRQR